MNCVKFKEPAYTPQVEAISPTPVDDLAAKSNHAELLGNIERLDREMAAYDNRMATLMKKKVSKTQYL